MSEVEKSIPLRCRGCHRFTGDLQRLGSLAGEIALIENSRYELERTFSPSDIDLQLANLALKLSEVKTQLTENSIYAIGCPGPDLSAFAGSGQTVGIAPCRSPLE